MTEGLDAKSKEISDKISPKESEDRFNKFLDKASEFPPGSHAAVIRQRLIDSYNTVVTSPSNIPNRDKALAEKLLLAESYLSLLKDYPDFREQELNSSSGFFPDTRNPSIKPYIDFITYELTGVRIKY